MQDLGFWILNDVIWRKTNPMPNFRGRRFTNAHETLIWAAREEGGRYTFNYEALKAGNEDVQVRSDWTLALCTGEERLKGATARRCTRPRSPRPCSRARSLPRQSRATWCSIPFFGAGTTGAVAKRLGRQFIGIERDAAYAAAAEARIAAIEPFAEATLAPFMTAREAPRVAFASLIERGLIKAGATVTDAKGRVRALVRADGIARAERQNGAARRLDPQDRRDRARAGSLQRLGLLARRGQERPQIDRRSARGRARRDGGGRRLSGFIRLRLKAASHAPPPCA